MSPDSSLGVMYDPWRCLRVTQTGSPFNSKVAAAPGRFYGAFSWGVQPLPYKTGAQGPCEFRPDFVPLGLIFIAPVARPETVRVFENLMYSTLDPGRCVLISHDSGPAGVETI